MKLFICALALVAVVAGQADVDWCAVKTKWCNGQNHILCQPNGFVPSPKVSNPVMLTLTQAQKDRILAAHNAYRNEVASGKYESLGYPAATKMGEMRWDNTLQYVAEAHAAYGDMQHDKCRATPDFRWSGQNLYQYLSSASTFNVDTVLDKGSKAWFDEINIANQTSLVDNFVVANLPAGHYSVMVNDKNNAIGCAASRFNYNYNGANWFGLLLTCNYEYTNMLNNPTYVRGASTSACGTKKTSTTYTSLCANV